MRVYLRDQDACYREKKLGDLLKEEVPIPVTYYIDEIEDYRFAITQFMPGITLRDLLLSDLPYDVSAMMYEVGILLSRITTHEFANPGFFDKNLNVITNTSSGDYLTFSKECLKHPFISIVLAPKTISKISYCFNKFFHFLSAENEKDLVHADFDPANILVDKINDAWKITGILDWEFSFSGSVLFDVANMLRYAHEMPSEFQNMFLKGLTDRGIIFPEDWQITVHLLNLLSLLDCLKRSNPATCPNQCTDICRLIDHILEELNDMSI